VKLDGRGLTAIPGFINLHTHLGDSAAKELGLGLKLEEAVAPPHGFKHRFLREAKPETLIRHMANSLRDMVSTGTVFFADFREGGIEGVKLLREALKASLIKGLILGRPKHPSENGDFEGELEGLAKAADGLGVGSLGSYTDSQLKLIAEKFKGKIRAAHAAEALKRREEASEVERALRLLKPTFLVHLTHAEEWELEEASRRKVGVAVCLRSNATFGLGLPDVKKMVDLGLKVGLGTDNVMTCQPNLFSELEFASRVLRLVYRDSSFPPPSLLLKMVTVWPAEILGLKGRLGVLEEGAEASFFLADLEAANVAPVHRVLASIVHRVRPENVMLTFVEGKIAFTRLPPGEWES